MNGFVGNAAKTQNVVTRKICNLLVSFVGSIELKYKIYQHHISRWFVFLLIFLLYLFGK